MLALSLSKPEFFIGVPCAAGGTGDCLGDFCSEMVPTGTTAAQCSEGVTASQTSKMEEFAEINTTPNYVELFQQSPGNAAQTTNNKLFVSSKLTGYSIYKKHPFSKVDTTKKNLSNLLNEVANTGLVYQLNKNFFKTQKAFYKAGVSCSFKKRPPAQFVAGALKKLSQKTRTNLELANKTHLLTFDLPNKGFKCTLLNNGKTSQPCFIYEFDCAKGTLDENKFKLPIDKSAKVDKGKDYLVKFLNKHVIKDGKYSITNNLRVVVYADQEQTKAPMEDVVTVDFYHTFHVVMQQETSNVCTSIIL